MATTKPTITHTHSNPCTGRLSACMCDFSFTTVELLSRSVFVDSDPVMETVCRSLSRTATSADRRSLHSSDTLRTTPVESYSVVRT